jgi:drug/metabolite transporter (DMT)-like permease
VDSAGARPQPPPDGADDRRMRAANVTASNAALFATMCLVWGLTWWPAKVGAAHVPPILLAAARFTIAGALMLAWAGRDALAVPRSALGRLVATALLVNTGNYALLFWGIARAPTGLAAIVNFATIPVFSLLASRWLEGEPIGGRRIAAIALGALGLALLFATRARVATGSAMASGDELAGLAAIALGTLLYCFGAVLSRPIAATLPVVSLAGWQTLVGGVGLVVLSLALEPVEQRHLHELVRWPTLPALVFLVAAGSLAGFTIYLRLLRDWGAFRAGLYAFVSPAIAVAVGVVVLGERFGWVEGVGGALMFVAAAIAFAAPAARRAR